MKKKTKIKNQRIEVSSNELFGTLSVQRCGNCIDIFGDPPKTDFYGFHSTVSFHAKDIPELKRVLTILERNI